MLSSRRDIGADSVIVGLLGIIVALVFSTLMLGQNSAQPASGESVAIPRQPDGKPDLTGVWGFGELKWSKDGGIAGRAPRVEPKSAPLEQPQLTPWAKEIFTQNKGKLEQDGNGSQQRDPSRWGFSPGPTRLLLTTQRPFEVAQFQDQIMLLFENDHWVRRIYMDGRGHPAGYPVSFMGHSIGKWEGDTLVVDTVSVDPRLWVNSKGYPQSDQMRIEERFRRVDKDTLQVETTFRDPKAYVKPWTQKQTYELYPTGPEFEIMEYLVSEERLAIGKPRPPKPVKYRPYEDKPLE